MSDAPSATEIITAVEQRAGRPLRAHIEVSDHCNEVCVHCYQVQGQKGEMSTEQLEGLLDELAAQGVLFLTISGGESTLRKDLFEILEYARSLGFALRLFTNGLTMTEAMARRLYALSVQAVEISLYSPRAEVHDAVTGVAGSFERSVAGIRHLVEAGVRVVGKTPIMSFNEEEAGEFMAFVRSLGAEVNIDDHDLMPREGGDRAPSAFNLDADARRRLLRLLDAQAPEAPGLPGPQPFHPDAPLCGAADGLHIEANGEIRPCTMLEVGLGNALEGGVAARADDPNTRSLKALRWRDVHGCRDCDLQPYCTRCHAASLADAGDALAPYASACKNARFNYETFLGSAPVIEQVPAGRDPGLGPYRALSGHRFAPVEDVVTPDDRALRARHAWIVRDAGASPAPAPVPLGKLVQIRRPGQKPRAETIPASPAKNSPRDVGEVGGKGTVSAGTQRQQLGRMEDMG